MSKFKVGDKVVPMDAMYGDLSCSIAWSNAKGMSQPFLYVNRVEKEHYVCDEVLDCLSGDHFREKDLELYKEPQFKVGDKVVPIDKTIRGGLSSSHSWNQAKCAGQPFLYISKVGDTWGELTVDYTCSQLSDSTLGDFFMEKDLIPYKETPEINIYIVDKDWFSKRRMLQKTDGFYENTKRFWGHIVMYESGKTEENYSTLFSPTGDKCNHLTEATHDHLVKALGCETIDTCPYKSLSKFGKDMHTLLDDFLQDEEARKKVSDVFCSLICKDQISLCEDCQMPKSQMRCYNCGRDDK